MSDNRAGGFACAPADIPAPAGGPAAEVRVRVLPDGELRVATLLGWNGDCVRLDLGDSEAAPGVVLEIEAGKSLYWGELREREGSACRIKVEHSLDRAALAVDREHWG